MAPPEVRTGTEQLDFEAAALNVQRKAAKSAANVAQFKQNFRTTADDVLQGRTTVSFQAPPEGGDARTADAEEAPVAADAPEGKPGAALTVAALSDHEKGELRSVLAKHENEVVAPATDGVEELGVQDMPEGRLGEATIGGEGRVSKQMLAGMENAKDAKQANHAGKHEEGHVDSVALSGEVVVDGKVEKVDTQYEAYAELRGNRGVGEGARYFRPGQPEDYRHAQEVGIVLEDVAGQEAFEQTLTGDGDVSRLQQKLDAKGRGRTPQQMREGVGAEIEHVLAA